MSSDNSEKVGSSRKLKVLKSLNTLGVKFCNEINKGEFPTIEMKSRSTDNILYDYAYRQYVLGDKTLKRNARNISHLRPFTQTVWTAYFAQELLKQGKTSTKRDVFYSAQAFGVNFKDQPESDNIVTDLETAIGYPREFFNIFPADRAAVFGDLTVEYNLAGYEGRRMNLSLNPDGMMIGPTLADSKFIETSADKVIVMEKGAMFTRFVEEKIHEKFKSILVHTMGMPPRQARYFIRRLNQELGLPVYIFCDADPWGIQIAMITISGAANTAHIRDLATPDAKWAGVWASDIGNYKLPSEKLTEVALKKLQDLSGDPQYKDDFWQNEIKTFMKIKKKCELEAFSRYGLTHITDTYLPKRLRELGA